MSGIWTELEREYSPSSMVEDLDGLIAKYRIESAAARSVVAPTTYSYGHGPAQTLDVFSAGAGCPVHVFIHGGYWQDFSKDDSSFPGPGFVTAGITYIAVNYGLAPRYSLDEIVEQVRSAIVWIFRNQDQLGFGVGRLVVSGSSAGAHLAAMVALTDWRPRGVPGVLIGGLVLLSGVYDLEPLISTYINDALGLDSAAARRNSPLRYVVELNHPVTAVVAWGEHETATFKSQSRAFALAWRRAGNPVVELEASGRNHFDIVHDLSAAASAVGAAALRLGRDPAWQ